MNDANDAHKQAALSLLRTTIAVVAGALIDRGLLTAEQAVEIGGALMVLVPAVWGYWNAHRSEAATQVRERVAVQAGAAEAKTGALAGIPVEAIGPNHAQDLITKLKETQP